MRPFSAPQRALVRPVSASYADCLRADAAPAIDVVEARRQHQRYADALRELAIEVVEVAADPAQPDACFVEDTAVVLGRSAIATRPGAPGRRAEVPPVAEALASHRTIQWMPEPCTLDGGDVLRAGDHLFVGLSSRTNAAGAAWLRVAAAAEGLEVHTIEVRAGLHLKSACTMCGPTTVIFDPALIDAEARGRLSRAGLSTIEAAEPEGANVLTLGSVVLVSSAAPRTAAALASLGLTVKAIDVGEIHKGDGALTCLSLRLAPEGSWCC